MKVNAAKTECLTLGTKAMLRDLPDVTINFCGNTIQTSRHARNLGVIFDESLSFQPHVDQTVRKCTGMLIALAHARHVVPMSTVKYLIPGVSHPYLRNVSSATSDVTALRRPDWARAPNRRLVVPGSTSARAPTKFFV